MLLWFKRAVISNKINKISTFCASFLAGGVCCAAVKYVTQVAEQKSYTMKLKETSKTNSDT